MENLSLKLKLGSSVVAIIAFAPVVATSAFAQNVAASATPVEEVVVTGTSIRGVAPVGSHVITVDQQAIQATGAVNLEQLLTTVTAISTANSAPQGANVNSLFQPQIHDVGGSISNATLAVIDGLRIPGAGGDSLVDPDIIPTAAIERVEVLADGASSIYGSDAVSGVVNFITRKSFDGVQLSVQGGVGDHYSNDTANFIAGSNWSTGSVMVAAGYLYQSQLTKASREFISAGDYTSRGGSNYDEVFGCPTASMVVPGSSGVYLSPSSTTTVPNNQASKQCDVQLYGAALPQEIRETALVRINQDFGDRLTTSVMFNYAILQTQGGSIPGSVTNVVAYGPGSGKGGQINPFYQAPAGAPAATQETINWVDLIGNGQNGTNYGRSLAAEDVFYSTINATYKLTSQWNLTFKDALGRNNYDTESVNAFCSACAILAINGTASTNGSTTASAIAGQNTVTLNTPLTTATALDIWDPAGNNKTNSLLAQSLYKGTTFNNVVNTFNQTKLELAGPLFDLPAGPVKTALGAEAVNYHFFSENVGNNGAGALLNDASTTVFRTTRIVLSGYAELNIPVVSPAMNIPWIKRVDLDVSARYDKYSDVGPTFNPKYAIDWTVTDGIKLRANYSTSFVAAPIGIVGDLSQGGEYSGGATSPPAFNVPVSIYPTVTQLPGCATATTTCSIGAGTLAPGLKRQYGTALTGAKPQTGNGWSVGADLAPDFLPGFSANVTLWNTNYKGGVTAPSPANIEASSILHNDLQLFPGGATQAQIDAFTRVPEGATVTGQPAVTYFTLDADETNVLNLRIQGIDLTTSYMIPTDWGTFIIGEGLTQFTKFTESTLDGPSYNILNTSGINSTFPSVATQNRMSMSWANDIMDVDLFWNFTSAYTNAGGTNINPIILDANGNFAGGGDHVHSNSTFDLHATYNFADGWFTGDSLYLDVKNIFDKAPPFYNYLNHDQFATNGYNSFLSNPIGRVISLGMRAKF